MFIENELKQNERRIESKVGTFLHISRLNARQTSVKALFLLTINKYKNKMELLGRFS